MLLKKKEDSSFLDFYKKKSPDNKSKFKKFLSNSINAFIVLHMIMGSFNMFRIENATQNIETHSNAMYDDYSEMQKAMKAGDQNKSISLFSKIKHYDTSIADLLLGGNILLINSQHDKDTPEEDRVKLTPETLKTLQYIYASSSGVEGEKKIINDVKCFYVDVACHIVMPHLKDKVLQNVDVVANKIEATNYNIAHMQEFQQWQKDIGAAIDKSPNGYESIPEELRRNPGQKYMDSLENK